MKWPYRSLKIPLNRGFYNDLKANFSDIADDFKELMTRIDNIISSSPQPSEVVDIRTDSNGEVFITAKARIDQIEKDTGYGFNIKGRKFGAIGDGNSHPLSQKYASLAAAQVMYPFATSLTQEIDSCALQKAINTGIGRVICSDGTFIVSEWNPTSDLKVVGNGMGKTILKLKDGYNSYMTWAGSIHDFSLEDITLDGNITNNTTTQTSLLEFRECYNLIFKRVRFANHGNFFMVSLDACYPGDALVPYMNLFSECEFDNFHTAGVMNTVLNSTRTKAGGNLFIDRCVFKNSIKQVGSAGVFVQKGSEHVKIFSCQFENMKDSASIITGGENITVAFCSGHTNAASLWFGTNGEESQMKNVHIIGNDFKSDTDTPCGISMVEGFTVLGNNFSESGLEGLYIIRSWYGTVGGNTLLNNGNFAQASTLGRANGVTITDSGVTTDECHDITFEGNTISDTRGAATKTQEYGINFVSWGRDITVTNNRLKGNKLGRIKTIPGRITDALIKNNQDMNYKLVAPGWSYTVDWSESPSIGLTLYATLGGLLDFTNGIRGDTYVLKISQDATGGRTIASWGANIKFPGGVAPSISQGANKTDILTFFYDGTNYYLQSIQQNM